MIFHYLQSVIIKLFLTEPCHQGSQIPTNCWNTSEHVLFSSQSQWSRPMHQHCSVGCARCTGQWVPCIQTMSLAKRLIFFLVRCISCFHSFLFTLQWHCLLLWRMAVWPLLSHMVTHSALQFPISARVETLVLFKWVLLIMQHTDHRHQTSATRSSFFSDTYCHGVNDLYLLKALEAVHRVQEQEVSAFFKVLETSVSQLCYTAVPLPPTGHKLYAEFARLHKSWGLSVVFCLNISLFQLEQLCLWSLQLTSSMPLICFTLIYLWARIVLCR